MSTAHWTTSPVSDWGVPLWIRLLLLLCDRVSPLLLQYSATARQYHDEGLKEFRLHCLRSFAARNAHPSSAALTASTSFPQFSALPTELRLLIWAEALPRARLLMLQLPSRVMPPTTYWGYFLASFRSGTAAKKSGDLRSIPPQILTSTAAPPSLLSVNAESRAVALRHYTLGFAPAGFPAPRVYVDMDRDAVAVSDALLSTNAGRALCALTPDLARVRCLCLPARGRAEEEARAHHALGVCMRRIGRVCAVESEELMRGTVPPLAREDWEAWMAQVEGRGLVEWITGGTGEEDGDGLRNPGVLDMVDE